MRRLVSRSFWFSVLFLATIHRAIPFICRTIDPAATAAVSTNRRRYYWQAIVAYMFFAGVRFRTSVDHSPRMGNWFFSNRFSIVPHGENRYFTARAKQSYRVEISSHSFGTPFSVSVATLRNKIFCRRPYCPSVDCNGFNGFSDEFFTNSERNDSFEIKTPQRNRIPLKTISSNNNKKREIYRFQCRC